MITPAKLVAEGWVLTMHDGSADNDHPKKKDIKSGGAMYAQAAQSKVTYMYTSLTAQFWYKPFTNLS